MCYNVIKLHHSWWCGKLDDIIPTLVCQFPTSRFMLWQPFISRQLYDRIIFPLSAHLSHLVNKPARKTISWTHPDGTPGSGSGATSRDEVCVKTVGPGLLVTKHRHGPRPRVLVTRKLNTRKYSLTGRPWVQLNGFHWIIVHPVNNVSLVPTPGMTGLLLSYQ